MTYNPISELLILTIEPLTMLLALGFGLGHWLPEIQGQPYRNFVLPAVAVIAATFLPYWQTAHGTFFGFKNSNPYWALLQTPLSARDLAMGEILWAAIKGTVAGLLVLVCGLFLGWTQSPWIWLSPLALFPNALFFAAVGLWTATWAKRTSTLVLMQIIGLGALVFWSDTLFPFSNTGPLSELLVWLSPLFHVVRPLRQFSDNMVAADAFLDLAIIWVLSSLTTNLATLRFERRLLPD